MNPNKLTPENASKYIGCEIIFTHNKTQVTRTLLRVSETGKTIYVNYPKTRNCLQLVTRNIFLLEKEKEKEEMIFPIFDDIHIQTGIAAEKEVGEKEVGEKEDGETYFMCTGTCGRVFHYEDTDGEGMCGTCQYHLSISASRKSKLATK